MFFYSEQDQQQAPPIVTDGLVLHLDAGDTNSYPGTGTTWYDLSGNGGVLQIQGSPIYSVDNGGYLLFDGVDDKAQITDQTVGDFLDTSINFAFDCWFNAQSVYPNSQPWGIQTIFGKGYTYISVGITQDRKIRFYWWSGGVTYIDSTAQIQLNEWNHVAVTSDSNGIKIFLNSQQSSTTNNGKPVFDTYKLESTPRFINIGGGHQTVYDRFTGKIAQVRLYQTTLTQQEVLQNFDASKATFGL